jgi:hypothetical protein
MSKCSCVFFGNPTNKIVTRAAHTWELLVANHLDQSIWLTNQKYWAPVRSNLLHSFLEVHTCIAPFTSQGKLYEFGAEKLISWAKLAHFDFFTINFTVWSLLSTGGESISTGGSDFGNAPHPSAYPVWKLSQRLFKMGKPSCKMNCYSVGWRQKSAYNWPSKYPSKFQFGLYV